MRSSQTFQKRQRELARQEKQRAKAQRKLEKKMEKPAEEEVVSSHLEQSFPPDEEPVS